MPRAERRYKSQLRRSCRALLAAEWFLDLVRSGYVGSRAETTQHLKTLVQIALNNDRAIVAAVQTSVSFSLPDDEDNRLDQHDIDDGIDYLEDRNDREP